jgi:opacity protein-like surface antigen
MKRLIAVSVMAVLLSSCSHKATVKELSDGSCTNQQEKLVQGHISGQIDAIAKKQWTSAYSFASPTFRSGVTLDQFIFVIATQYVMLIENQGYEFNSCTFTDNKFTEEVGVKSSSGLTNLTYTLSLDGSTLGVESAVIVNADTQLAA